MNLIEEMNPFMRAVTLYEKRAELPNVIRKMKKRYVTFKELQSELELEDHEMDDLISSVKRKNRHSNKYIFTEIDGEQAIGITASKRKTAKRTPEVSVASGDLVLGKRRSHKKKMSNINKMTNQITNAHESNLEVDYSRHFNLKRNFKRSGWKALMREHNFPENWKELSVDEVIMQMSLVEKTEQKTVNDEYSEYKEILEERILQ